MWPLAVSNFTLEIRGEGREGKEERAGEGRGGEGRGQGREGELREGVSYNKESALQVKFTA